MVFVTSNHPDMRDIKQEPFWKKGPHHWSAIVIMKEPFHITIFVKECNDTIVVPTSGISIVVHQCSNLVWNPCNAEPGIREAGQKSKKVSKVERCSIDRGGILKPTNLEAQDMRSLFNCLQHTI